MNRREPTAPGSRSVSTRRGRRSRGPCHQGRGARRPHSRHSVRLRLPQHHPQRRLLRNHAAITRALPRRNWKPTIPAPPRSSSPCAGAIRTQIPAARIALAEQHGKELAAEAHRVLDGPLTRCVVRYAPRIFVTTLAFAPQSPTTYEADLANPKASTRGEAARAIHARPPGSGNAVPGAGDSFRQGTDAARARRRSRRRLRFARQTRVLRRALIVAGYANSVMCYIPSERVLAREATKRWTTWSTTASPAHSRPVWRLGCSTPSIKL